MPSITLRPLLILNYASNISDIFEYGKSTCRQNKQNRKIKKTELGMTLNRFHIPGVLESMRGVTCLCQLCKISFRVRWSNTIQEVKPGISKSVL